MRTIHIGHHFFGAGNLGDDWMMAGFLSALPKDSPSPVQLSCCVPYPSAPLKRRFPEVEWLPYTPEARQSAIEACQVWLGLGGSPFQTAGSRWFIDHLAEEARLCAAAGKPMDYLGISGQDPEAYALPEIRRVLGQARKIWTRDTRTAEAIAVAASATPVVVGADLAHLYFRALTVPRAQPGRFAAVLNFDFAEMPLQLPAMLGAATVLGATEKVWAVQEERPLPGAELELYGQLPAEVRQGWSLRQEQLENWPSGEWLLASRFHATLAGAWAGSKAVVIATNEKLRGVAEETGFPLFELNDDPAKLPGLFARSQPVAPEALAARADLAAKVCAEFFDAI